MVSHVCRNGTLFHHMVDYGEEKLSCPFMTTVACLSTISHFIRLSIISHDSDNKKTDRFRESLKTLRVSITHIVRKDMCSQPGLTLSPAIALLTAVMVIPRPAYRRPLACSPGYAFSGQA